MKEQTIGLELYAQDHAGSYTKVPVIIRVKGVEVGVLPRLEISFKANQYN